MNLWVRSQDKRRLTICIDFQMQEKLKATYAILGGKYGNHILGIYNSKERALEILDEISTIINEYEQTLNEMIVYQMPQE